MKRSEINGIIRDRLASLREHRFLLPCFATWTPDDWKRKGPECAQIARCQLGWDITDCGSGMFPKIEEDVPPAYLLYDDYRKYYRYSPKVGNPA